MDYHNIQSEMNDLEKFVKALQELSAHTERQAVDVVNAEDAYNRAFAKMLYALEAKGEKATNLKDKANGADDVADLRKAWKISEALFNATKLRLKNVQSAIDAKRTIISHLKTEFKS